MRRILASGVLLLAACQITPPTLPDGYVPLGTGTSTSLTAVASSGNRYQVREHENPPSGTLEFWVEAVRRELVEARGYELQSSAPFPAETGATGHELRFTAVHQLQEFQYLVTVFVRDKRVVVFEAGGEREPFERDLQAVRDAIQKTSW